VTLVNPLLGRRSPAVTPIRRGGVTGRSGEFGPTRRNADGSPKMHKGLDLLCSEGWPVFAAHAGVITKAGWENASDPRQGYGQRVWVAAGDGSVKTVYAHLSKILVAVGEYVATGRIVGLSGRTGNVAGGVPTHLHFEVHAPEPVDPAPLLVARNTTSDADTTTIEIDLTRG
jgi:murein DD-endopeptidase MepM/ murein hydrolase activator NlpD